MKKIEKNPGASALAGKDTKKNKTLTKDPHTLYPTSICRHSSGTVENLSIGNKFHIKSKVVLESQSSVRVIDGIFDINNRELMDIYKPLGRCIMVVDRFVYDLYGTLIDSYFDYYKIPLISLIYRAWEKDKNIKTIQAILTDFKKHGVQRQEAVLIIGGGVIADVGGFACATYHRYTPYVMIGTSIVSGIDAGPSPRTCCDADGYKNLYGAYQAPILTFVDRKLFKTLSEGCLRHGMAEIVKMAVMKDYELFCLLEKYGLEVIRTKFATIDRDDDKEFIEICRRIIFLALLRYVEAEYVNMYETHQMRPHAYGHTWSPGFELPTGLLHGHAVSICMSYGATLAHTVDWIKEEDRDRIINLCDMLGLSTHHPVLNDFETMWNSQLTVIQKRGGNLCAPLPKGLIGRDCGYLNEVSKNLLTKTVAIHQKLAKHRQRGGKGIDMYLTDLGLI